MGVKLQYTVDQITMLKQNQVCFMKELHVVSISIDKSDESLLKYLLITY